MLDERLDDEPGGGRRDVGTCPVKHFTVFDDVAAGHYWAATGELREETPAFFNDHAQGYWVVTRHDAVKDLYQRTDLFSSESFTAWEPNPPYRFVPTQIDPPEHIKYRQLLNPKFSPGAVGRAEGPAREIAERLISQIAPSGRCDFVADFAIRFPTEVFLTVIGLPPADADLLVPWVEDFFLGLNGAEDKVGGMVAALEGIRGYFVDLLAQRRETPADPETDLIQHLLESEVDGEPLSDTVLLDMCTVLVLAGLDTTRGQLGYLFQFLAERPDVRQQIVDDPSLIPACVEESLRLHSITIADARKATKDAEFHGCPVRAGDMVMGLVAAANRDPRHYESPDEFRLDRKGNHHFGFAGGPHRCLGAHLARREMIVAVEAWHAAIPHYEIDEGAELRERGGQLTLISLPLHWTPAEGDEP
ncbi:cytochrome P450 [Desertimonas flava]|jgi:cytochrome P450|uniref:cytochrome P450 n=1 Tax=Desertimonas flava TaxID=2064846 RepID=UPI000E347CD6|nr:cytochrome P450 [Desertimonas flava]